MTNESIDYVQVLADLKARRAKLDAAIEAIEAIVGGEMSATAAGTSTVRGNLTDASSGSIASDAFFGMSIADAIKKFLALSKGPRTVKEVSAGLERGGVTHSSKDFYNTVYTILTRKPESFVKLPTGGWGLTEWYPRRRARPNAPDGSDSDASQAPDIPDVEA